MHHPDTPNVVHGVHCEHIRHKAMYVMSVPNPQALRFFDPYDTASYWCAETSTAFGPMGSRSDATAASTAGAAAGIETRARRFPEAGACSP